MMIKSAGNFLREKREEKNISIKDAAESINMTTRHIQALEDDNFAIFPGETYALGFLRSYASFLGADPDYAVQLFRGAQLVEKEVPLQELTRPTLTPMDHVRAYGKHIAAVFGAILLVIIGINIFNSVNNNSAGNESGKDGNVNSFLSSGSRDIPDVETENIVIRGGFATALIPVGKGIDFSVQNAEVFLILKELKYKQSSEGISEAGLIRYPGKVSMTLKENQPLVVSDSNLPRKFNLTLMGATPNNIKVQISLGENIPANGEQHTDPSVANANENENTSRVLNSENFKIIFHGKTTSDNYVEFYVDGVPKRQGLLGAESVIHYEAEDSIQFKIGDAGSMNILINNKEYKFGQPGQQIKKIIRKAKDPLNQTQYKIVIKDL